MKRITITLTIILFVSLTTLSCIGFGTRPGETPSPAEQSITILENWSEQPEESTDSMNNSQPADQPQPEQKSAKPASGDISSSASESLFSEENEYAVSATNFGCTCSIDTSTMSISLDIDGDQLTYAGKVYNKIADNTYKRTYMGYYINVSGEGENKTTTQVDEERHDIIILTEDGFISEHYQGDEGSPCCYHTFKLEK
ncbi:MAG: hypothetical protein K0B14_01200 [Anaerolineaceae bacterium]|nr:hypothetical protein [Anaerolineaceae bacterium]